MDVNLSPKVKRVVNAHGNTRSYLHRLKITGSPECPYKHGIQPVDHLILQCNRLKNEREILKKNVFKEGKWPASKSELTDRNLKQFVTYLLTYLLTYSMEQSPS